MSQPAFLRSRLRFPALTRRWFLAGTALTLVTLACNTSTPTPTAGCDESYTKKQRTELHSICATSALTPWHPVAPVPAGMKASATPDGVALGLEPIRLTAKSDGSRYGLPFDLEDAWTSALEGKPQRWSLSIAPEATAQDVGTVLEWLASKGARSGELVFLAPYETPPVAPRNPALYEELRELSRTVTSADTDPEVAAAAQKTLEEKLAFSKECTAIGNAKVAMASGPVTERCTTYADGMAEALRECGCPSWADDQMTVAYWTFLDNPPTGTPVSVSVTLETGGTKPAPESTWSDIAKTLRSGTIGPFGLKPD